MGLKKVPPTDERPWSVPVRISEVPQEGRSYRLEPDERIRAAIATAVGLAAVPRLQADFTLSRNGRDGLRVSGQVTASVGQTCVVSLEPMESEVSEPIELAFTAEGERTPRSLAVDVSAGLDAADPPEPLENGSVDLGRIAVEFLVLGIDPYPRKPDARFQAPANVLEEDAAAHPFAALQSLKKGS
jgi:uncharacterized metal-binding protein YceD (DUF177 family)